MHITQRVPRIINEIATCSTRSHNATHRLQHTKRHPPRNKGCPLWRRRNASLDPAVRYHRHPNDNDGRQLESKPPRARRTARIERGRFTMPCRGDPTLVHGSGPLPPDEWKTHCKSDCEAKGRPPCGTPYVGHTSAKRRMPPYQLEPKWQ